MGQGGTNSEGWEGKIIIKDSGWLSVGACG